jgi:hypothetical protein
MAAVGLRFDYDGPDGLIDGKAFLWRPRLDENQRAALAAAIYRSLSPAAHGVARWRLVELLHNILDEFAVSIDRVPQRGVGSRSRRFDLRLGRVNHAAMDDSVTMGSSLICDTLSSIM